MRIYNGDIWHLKNENNYIGVTTNHTVTKQGKNVMGGGIALEAAERFPHLPKEFADLIMEFQNFNVFVFHDYQIFTFKTKEDVWLNSTLTVIERSCKELKELADTFKDTTFYLPAPGCGLGGLTWEQVEPLLQKYFKDNDNVVVCFK